MKKGDTGFYYLKLPFDIRASKVEDAAVRNYLDQSERTREEKERKKERRRIIGKERERI